MMHFTLRTSLVGVSLVAILGWATSARAVAGQQQQQKPAPAAADQNHAAEDGIPALRNWPFHHSAPEIPGSVSTGNPVRFSYS